MFAGNPFSAERLRALVVCLMAIVSIPSPVAAQSAPGGSSQNLPHLRRNGQVTQLIVDGQPFLALAGELRNSSSSNLEYMQPIWPKLVRMNLNTVLAVVSWEQVEPEEGKFDFTMVDGLIEAARRHNLRLGLLWFGSWKNATSRYAADWVKANEKRFPRVKNRDGKTLEILSALNEETREADARAFARFMRHIREVDAKERTVIMIQVQNEVGVLGDSRDRSAAANEAFAKPVPKELMSYLQKQKGNLLPELLQLWEAAGSKTSGTWEEVFGQGTATDEVFMAWHYARFTGRLAEAGKAEYPLPMFVNAWIVQPEDKGPGDYPSGGPVAHVHDIWRAGAPQLDILAPDIYLPNFPEIVASYSRSRNPMFIPESRAGAGGAANAFYAIGQHGAMGYSPFAIEERETDLENGPMTKAYNVLAQLSPLILEHQAKGSIAGVWLTKDKPVQQVELGSYALGFELRRNRRTPSEGAELGYAIVLATGPDEYVVSGMDVQVTFALNPAAHQIVGLLSVEEGAYVSGRWIAGRRLNGDEVQLRYDLSVAAQSNQSGAGLRFPAGGPTIQRVKLYRYQ
ncbi:MAG: DUF5597 domain-containing protein [Pyrinomonadaceae bacterium]|nr:DUF5597 domain-containing protein [Pyrinomonadaceae bacterium]